MIKQIAERESCIFVGRCADYVLRGTGTHVMSVFVSAPTENRIRRKMLLDDLSCLRAKQIVRKMDLQRKAYYEQYTGNTWGNPQNYHLNINTSEVTIDKAVELIIDCYHGL